MNLRRLAAAFALVCLSLAGPALARAPQARHEMVAAANPLAAQAGLDILRQGGSAVDAAIAVQMVLTLVEPQSSGIGGGAFLLYYNGGKTGPDAITSFDGRETAPAAAAEDLFLDADGHPPDSFLDAIQGGRSVGVPGVVRMFAAAHEKYGKLPWARLFQPAIRLAENGFRISPRLYFLLDRDPILRRMQPAAGYFYRPDGSAKPTGTLLKNPGLAATLRAIAADPEAFYRGPIAADIVDAVANAPVHPGRLALSDLAAYRPVERAPVCGPYRVWRVCGMAPPSSGGSTSIAILGLLQGFDLAALDPAGVDFVHLVTQAERLAYADRDLYVADPDFVPVRAEALVDPAYLADRAKRIDPTRDMGKAAPGTPLADQARTLSPGRVPELPSTSHYVVADRHGNIVSITTSVENAFGSRVMVDGFMLNNTLTDFSLVPTVDGKPVANRVQPGKRPRSSMSPTIVLDGQGRPVVAIGSPGGPQIIAYVSQALLAWFGGMDMQRAISLPHFVNPNGDTVLEKDSAITALRPALEARGHSVREATLNSGLEAVVFSYGPHGRTLTGASDPRREGVAVGN